MRVLIPWAFAGAFNGAIGKRRSNRDMQFHYTSSVGEAPSGIFDPVYQATNYHNRVEGHSSSYDDNSLQEDRRTYSKSQTGR